MAYKILINGFGRIGKLATRLAWYDHKKDFILSGGINLELISSIKKLKNQLPNLIGVDLNSKFEIKPGLKDINRVKKFIKSIKNENT